jgi:hypothetical protein
MGVKFNPFTGNLDLIDTTAAAGLDGQVQFNSSGLLDGSADFTWDDTGKVLDVGGDINLASTKEYRIAATKVLDATSLGSGVVTSSLTSVGTIATGTWQGTAIDKTYLDATLVSTGDTGTVTSTMIADGTIVDADVNASAAIAGTKINPDFGSQTVDTSGLASLSNLMLAFAQRGASIGIPGQPLFGVGPAVTSTTPVGIGPHDYYPIDLFSGSFM